MTPVQSEAWQVHPGNSQSDAHAKLAGGDRLDMVFLSDTMARVYWHPSSGFREPRTWAIAPTHDHRVQDVPWEGRSRSSLEGFERPSIIHTSEHTISTRRLKASFEGGNGLPVRVIWRDAQSDQVILQDRVTSAYLHEKRTGLVRHSVVRDPNEYFFGLGDKTGPLNLHGRRLRCMGQDAIGYDAHSGDPLYKHWPFVITRTIDGLWTGIYYDTLSACTFDLGCEHDNYHGLFRSVDIDDGDLDYYFMLGTTPAEVVAQFVQLIGGSHLPPRWTLGFAQTAMGLADAPDAQDQLDAFIDECQRHKVPISAFHYGSGYSSRGKQRYVFTWNRSKFPDPKRLNEKFRGANLKLVANLKPCLLDDHPAYSKLAKEHAFIEHENTHQPVVEPYWDGQGSHLDFTRPNAVKWWQEQLRSQILDYGIQVGWNDNNEYAIAAEDAFSAGWGKAIPMHRSRPLHALLMTRASFEAQREDLIANPDRDHLFTVTRAGPPGIQRYAQTWSGDNTTSWKTLKWNIRTGLQMSLSGMFNVGHDVGGFFGPVPDPELFLRWVQACALNPRMVMNSWKEGNVSNLPWMHPEVTDAIRSTIELRYRLMPYLWACFEAACSTHQPIIRPTFFDFPDDQNCLNDCDEFMLGEALLVAPVVGPGANTRKLYLPKLPDGQRWFNFHTREAYPSGSIAELDAPMSLLPLLVREGKSIEVSAPKPGAVAHHDDPVVEVLRFN
ncbi:TIM-barrel domain-containing protein [Limnohabitans sp. MORI2]|uniref:glycoside hydrolase family 31 protein n=1 Tax=Limnohabitans sp. MORI2 TaxID=1751150 RepID=UPI002491101F|nr:TIM-barrel domain-containing protein [Limnohabitans sp. MORI2]